MNTTIIAMIVQGRVYVIDRDDNVATFADSEAAQAWVDENLQHPLVKAATKVAIIDVVEACGCSP